MMATPRVSPPARSASVAQCALCGSTKIEPVWNRGEIRVDRCCDCGVLFVAERTLESQTAEMYDEGVLLKGRTNFSGDYQSTIPAWKQREHHSLLDTLGSLGIQDGHLLDVGCYAGTFLWHAKDRGFQIMGVEPSAHAARFVQDVLRLPVVHGTLTSASFPSESFVAVSLLDVIEHVPDPVQQLREVFRVLRPGGILILTTPNAAGLPQCVVKAKRKLFGQDWCPIDDVPWHLWGFTRKSLRLCVEQAGFTVERPTMLLPSFSSTNDQSGAPLRKKIFFQLLSKTSQFLGMSDRMALFARKPVKG